jgi:hypothetical protein
VQADIEAPQHWWLQWSRYHFQDIISSQSKMHRITKMDIEKQCTQRVTSLAIQNLQNCIALYMVDPSPENFELVLDNTPSGLQLIAGITTNYLQLKTEYNQRKNHRLSGWNKVFREWCEGLPMFKELCLGETEDKPPKNWEEFLETTTDVFIAKNKDYGDRYTKALMEHDCVIWEWEVDKKIDRIRTWVSRGQLLVKSEGLNNAVQDLFNYTVLYELYLDSIRGQYDPCTRLTPDDFLGKATGRTPELWLGLLESRGRIKPEETAVKRVILRYMGAYA